MFVRLLALILGICGIALILLVARQQQIATVHAIAVTHQRIEALDAQAWALRAQLAALTAPTPVREGLKEDSDLLWQLIPVGRPGTAPATTPEEVQRGR